MNSIIEILKKYNIRPNKSLGQNFLIDEFVIGKILDAADVEGGNVLEIGGGLGSLTGALLERAKKVIVVEIDGRMCEILNMEYGGFENLEIINADILKTDIASIAEREGGISICANLPYYITTPIIMYILESNISRKLVKSLTLMMQKEVADRILAPPGSKDYGAITPSIRYYADAASIANVPPNCFIPRPNVQSTVIKFDILPDKRVLPKSEKLMKDIIRYSFSQRRKTLLNALSNQLLPNIGITKEQLLESFSQTGIGPSQRGETLSLEQFCELSDAVYDFTDSYK